MKYTYRIYHIPTGDFISCAWGEFSKKYSVWEWKSKELAYLDLIYAISSFNESIPNRSAKLDKSVLNTYGEELQIGEFEIIKIPFGKV